MPFAGPQVTRIFARRVRRLPRGEMTRTREASRAQGTRAAPSRSWCPLRHHCREQAPRAGICSIHHDDVAEVESRRNSSPYPASAHDDRGYAEGFRGLLHGLARGVSPCSRHTRPVSFTEPLVPAHSFLSPAWHVLAWRCNRRVEGAEAAGTSRPHEQSRPPGSITAPTRRAGRPVHRPACSPVYYPRLS